jgi:hypothetical protein
MTGRPRLPMPAMLCVLDHLSPGLPVGPQLLLDRYGRRAHDPGCGIWPGLRFLSRETRTSPVTLRQWRDYLQDLHRIERLPRKGPHGADLTRLGPCPDDACRRQRDRMQSRCEDCQRDNLQHAETQWWQAQRDYMQSRKREIQGEPWETPVARGPHDAGPDGGCVVSLVRPAPSEPSQLLPSGTTPWF